MILWISPKVMVWGPFIFVVFWQRLEHKHKAMNIHGSLWKLRKYCCEDWCSGSDWTRRVAGDFSHLQHLDFNVFTIHSGDVYLKISHKLNIFFPGRLDLGWRTIIPLNLFISSGLLPSKCMTFIKGNTCIVDFYWPPDYVLCSWRPEKLFWMKFHVLLLA